MAEVTYAWPAADKSHLLGTRVDRLDGLVKSTGMAKYTYDVNLPNQLIVRALGSPHAHCRVKSVDTSEAKRVPGVVLVHVIRAPGVEGGENVEIQCQGELIAAVAAETEAAAAAGVDKIKVEYELLDVFADDDDLDAAQQARRTSRGGLQVELENEPGDDVDDEEAYEEQELERLFSEADHVVEGYYGIDVITHCCLETHGATVRWNGDKLEAFLSTQNVSGTDEGFAVPLGITSDDVEVKCDYIGGGFGSKFAPDHWSIIAARMAKETGRPIKFMLTREQDQQIAGNRPSAFCKVRLGADSEGLVTVWDSHHWGTAGYGGGGVSNQVVPYVLQPKNYRRQSTVIRTNLAPQRAWRAPNHPQGCAISQTAYDDLAAKMGADSLEIFRKNLANISASQPASLYEEELRIAAELMDWKAKWHPHGQGPRDGSVVEGLGLGIHQWGGGANSSECRLKIYPDGAVESFCGTQDLGTGTRTVCAIVLAETLGLPIDGVKVNIGSSKYPFSGASGGSTTVGAVSESHRRAGQDALAQLFEKVAPELDAEADQLEAVKGRIQVAGNPDRSLSWKEACRTLGMRPLEVTSTYRQGTRSPLSNSGVGGVQMAHVRVDTETGVVKMVKMVAVQDIGLIVNPKTAESQVYGAQIMTIAYSLFEQRIVDPTTGEFVNAGLADYKLPRLGDIGELVVHLLDTPEQRARGVIGLGEPPVISGGAAISNAVSNAIGVRVPVLPLTPKRVLDALRTA